MSGKIKRYSENENGWTEWIQPEMKLYRLGCCDCGLVHDVQFRITARGRRVQFRVRQNKRSTGQIRRHMR